MRELKPTDFDSFIHLSNMSLWRDYPGLHVGHAMVNEPEKATPTESLYSRYGR